MKTLLTVILFSCCSVVSLTAASPEPFSKTYGYELLRYLYRWHLDDTVLADTLVKEDTIDLYYRSLARTLDEGDESEYLEVIMPLTKLVVVLKRSEYTIPELKIELKDPYYKVQSVQYYSDLAWDEAQYQLLSYEYEDAMAYLFRTRNDQQFPDAATLTRLREEARVALQAEGYVPPEGSEGVVQVAYVAPISIVSNDLWFYWVNGRKFIRFSADLHHSHERFWEFAQLNVEMIDADEQVVVSQLEQHGPGYFTKDYVGRILFNCIIHGQQVRFESGKLVDVSSD